MKKFLPFILFIILCFQLVADSRNEIVILIHGLRGTTDDMQIIADYLEKHKYRTVNITYPSKDDKIQNLAEDFLKPEVLKQIEKHPPKIHFVTHSMGGIVLRSYLENHFTEIDSILGKVVMIAPPNKGSDVSEFFKKTMLYQKRYGIAGQQIGYDINKQVSLLDSVSYKPGIIAGTDTQFPYFSYFIKGEDDGKISVQRAKLKGMGDYIEMHFPHDTIMEKKEVAKQVLFFIENGEFRD
jgi:predicted alpha/beta hydrolase family esterase